MLHPENACCDGFVGATWFILDEGGSSNLTTRPYTLIAARSQSSAVPMGMNMCPPRADRMAGIAADAQGKRGEGRRPVWLALGHILVSLFLIE